MFRSSTQIIPCDDVTVRCTIRRSKYARNKDLSQPRDMVCTMKMWHDGSSDFSCGFSPTSASIDKEHNTGTNNPDRKSRMQRRKSNPQQHFQEQQSPGPQLIFMPIHAPGMSASNGHVEPATPLSIRKRFASFGSKPKSNKNGGQRQSPTFDKEPLVLPTSDIMLVDSHESEGGSDTCTLTTMTNGFMECKTESPDGQKAVLAFLRANIPANRFVDTTDTPNTKRMRARPSVSSVSVTSNDAASFDVDAFVAKRITERIEKETFGERMRRKMARIVLSLEEVTGIVTDCMCGCNKETDSPKKQAMSGRTPTIQSKYSIQFCGDGMELDTAQDDQTIATASTRGGSSTRSTISKEDSQNFTVTPTTLPDKADGRKSPLVLETNVLGKQYSHPRLSMEYSDDANSAR